MYKRQRAECKVTLTLSKHSPGTPSSLQGQERVGGDTQRAQPIGHMGPGAQGAPVFVFEENLVMMGSLGGAGELEVCVPSRGDAMPCQFHTLMP